LDDERLEQIKEWWKEYRWTVIGGVSLGLATVVGVNVWNAYTIGKAEAASDLYERITLDVVENRFDSATRLADQLIEEFPNTAYAGKTALIQARIQHELGNSEQVRKLLRWVIDNATEISSAHAARLQLARLMNAEKDYEGASSMLDIDDITGFESHYHELRGDALRGLQRFEEAYEQYERSLETLAPGSGYRALLNLKLNDVNVQN